MAAKRHNTRGALFALVMLSLCCGIWGVNCFRVFSPNSVDIGSKVYIGEKGYQVQHDIGKPDNNSFVEDPGGITNTWTYGSWTITLRNAVVTGVSRD